MTDREALRRAWSLLTPEERDDLHALSEAFEGDAAIEFVDVDGVREYP